MKLMIDITEVEFNACKRVVEAGVADWQDKIIASGTPLPTGEWIDHGLIDECTNCNKYTLKYSIYGNNYCPNCGAKMKGEKNE